MKTKINYPLVGQILRERYQILQVLGTGAFGQTYAVCDLLDPAQPQYALKHYPRRGDRSHLARASQQAFATEAQILKQVGVHPQIPQFIDAFELDGGGYLVQEAILGQTLGEYLLLLHHRDRAEREIAAIALLKDVLPILDFIHQRGLIHCDLKPNNLIKRTEDGKWVLIDFGNAQPVRQWPDSTPLKSAVAVSPSGYLAAELLTGKPHANSDLYALGAIAIEMLTGQNPARLQLDIERGELAWLPENRAASGLETILQEMVRYDARQRYASARGAFAALSALEKNVAPLPPQQANLLPSPRARLESAFEAAEASAPLEMAFDPSLGPAGLAVAPSKPTHPLLGLQWHRIPFFVTAGVTLAAANTATIGLGMHAIGNVDNADPGEQLLAKAREAYREGQFDRAFALARAVPPESFSYEDSQASIGRWQKDWQQASERFEAIERAFAQHQWETVLTRAGDLPEIAFWQQKLAPLVTQAQVQAETEAQALLEKAFARARERDFTRALGYLEQILPQTPTGASIQPKLKEYRSKQQVRATVLLQQAYDLAQQREFGDAIALLEQIAPETPVGAIAQSKIVEYTEKQEIKAKVLPPPGIYLRVHR